MKGSFEEKEKKTKRVWVFEHSKKKTFGEINNKRDKINFILTTSKL